MKRRRRIVALAAALVAGIVGGFSPGVASNAATPGTTSITGAPAHHVVYAGNLYDEDDGGPAENSSAPFVHTTFSPERLQVHAGDTVEWKFSAGYGGWHTVTFDRAGRPPLWRADEYPGTIGITGEFLHGHERGYLADQCGRTDWHHAELDQEPCILDGDALEDGLSSSLADRFFSTSDAGSFVVEVGDDLEPGTYSYFCKYHLTMNGAIEVLPPTAAPRNPSFEEIEAQHAADEAHARHFVEDLKAKAYNPVTKEWTVHAGALTDDGRIAVLEYIPSDIAARKGDKLTFVAGGAEPHTVSFPREKLLPGEWENPDDGTVDFQGGFSTNGACDVDECTGTIAAPRGLVGFAYPWACEYDELDRGAPGVLASYLLPTLEPRTPGETTGCPDNDGSHGRLEFIAGPYMAQGQPAPLDLVITPETVHNSGILMESDIPAGFRLKPDGTEFPGTFDARFPTAGEFSFGCFAHEFMEGTIRVS